MLFKKPLQKSKIFILKTLQSLKNMFFGGYEKIPRTLFLNPLSCSSINQRSHQLDHIYSQLNQQQNSDHLLKTDQPIESTINILSLKNELEASTELSPSNDQGVTSKKQLTNHRKFHPSPSSASSFRHVNRVYKLAQTMKELEMIDSSDVDQSLDVEEALHYYARLTCPVYLDIVNKFFMDMYAEFLLPQPSISLSATTSSRRLGPIAL